MMQMPTFYDPNEPLGDYGTLGDFWRWAMSDLLGNRNRGILADYIVGKILGADMSHPRLEWDCYDLMYRGKLIEVKSSAYIQSWHTHQQRSKINFGIAPHLCWDARTNTYLEERRRWADCNIFCVFPRSRQDFSRNVLDLSHWSFYFTSTENLEKQIDFERKNISLALVRQICGEPLSYLALKHSVDTTLNL